MRLTVLMTMATVLFGCVGAPGEADHRAEKIYVAVWETSLYRDKQTKEIRSSSPGKSHIAVIDPVRREVTKKIAVGDCPMRLGMTRNGRFLYVPCQMATEVSVIDTESDHVVATIPAAGAQGVDFLPDGSRAYTSTAAGVFIVDGATFAVIKTLSYKGGYYVRTSPAGRSVIVTGYDKKNYAVIDTATDEMVVRELPDADSGTKGVCFVNDEEVIMVTGGHRLSRIAIADGAVRWHATMPNKSWLCIVDRAEGEDAVYVTDSNEKRIYRVAGGDGRVLGTVATAGVGAIGLGFLDGALWTTDFLGNGNGTFGIVSIIDVAQGKVVGSLNIGKTPTGIAVKSRRGNRGS